MANDAYCLARLDRLTEAVERLEGGRTRALAEALARDPASLAEATVEVRAAFEDARDRIKTLEAAARAGHDSDSPQHAARSFLELSSELALARKKLAETIERIRAYVPAFMAEGLTLGPDQRGGLASSSPRLPANHPPGEPGPDCRRGREAPRS